MQIKNKIGIAVKYLPATDYRGSRVRLSLPRSGNPSVVIPYDHAESSIVEMAANYLLEKTGLEPVAQTQFDFASAGCDLLLFDWFDGERNNFSLIVEKVFSKLPEKEDPLAEKEEEELLEELPDLVVEKDRETLVKVARLLARANEEEKEGGAS